MIRKRSKKPLPPSEALDQATANQRLATDPGRTVWLAANAGSGKTYVLTDRLARLLLDGVRPAAILCLTFTKAGAAEMKNRLFEKLSKWAVADDDALRSELLRLLGRNPTEDMLPKARRLFATALDAPGGLRIQTIHAFCEGLLKRFPVEAEVSPQFSIADDQIAGELSRTARDDMLRASINDPLLGPAVERLVSASSEEGFTKVLETLIGSRAKLAAMIEAHGGGAAQDGSTAGIDNAIGQTFAGFGANPGLTPEGVAQSVMRAVPEAAMRRAASALAGGSTTDKKSAAAMLEVLDGAGRDHQFDQWKNVFLTQKDEKRAKLATNGIANKFPEVMNDLGHEQERMAEALEEIANNRTAHLSAAAIRVGAAFIERYSEGKRRHALLDYDDLIALTRQLLHKPGIAPWVLYRLDAGLDHVLVDEAQDTSPEQWDVVLALTEEFFAGAGARETARNLFVVGDVKQSIFSFQGANPVAFRDNEAVVKARAGASFSSVQLGVSFRSVPTVLEAVDRVFTSDQARAGVVRPPEAVSHKAVRLNEPGLVELWPIMQTPARADEEEPWDAPLDYQGEASAPVMLARRIAGEIGRWLASGDILPSTGQPVRPGDIMVLVRRRDAFFTEMVRALKQANIDVAGADRMNLGEQLVVRDLLALADFVLQPEDDLALAVVLKGPLFGITDSQLFDIAHDRPANLWRALKQRAVSDAGLAPIVAELGQILSMADFKPPFEFFSRILGDMGGRKRILARLGPESAEAIDEFLDRALIDERESAPNLQGFVQRFRVGSSEIKRDLQQARDEVRILTVHGAKGLEAPIVILPDTCRVPSPRSDAKILWTEAPGLGLGGQVRDATPFLVWSGAAPLAVAAKTQVQNERLDEYRRLLYVALTRACDRLYVTGWTGKRPPDAGCWYNLVDAGLREMPGIVEVDLPFGGKGLRFTTGDAAELTAAQAEQLPRLPEAPAWVNAMAPAEPEPARPLAPSRADDEQPTALGPFATGAEDRRRFRRGRLVHRLLQTLPDLAPAHRDEAARRFMTASAADWTEEERIALIAEVAAVISDPRFASVFGPGSRPEAPIAGRAGDRIISGTIDRLVFSTNALGEGEILVVDFKSNRPPPDSIAATDTAYLKQMAAYRYLLEAAHPGHRVRAALIWTNGPQLMEIPDDLLDAAAVTIGLPSNNGPGPA